MHRQHLLKLWWFHWVISSVQSFSRGEQAILFKVILLECLFLTVIWVYKLIQIKGYIYISSFVLSLPNQYLCILEYSCYKINFVTEAALGSQIWRACAAKEFISKGRTLALAVGCCWEIYFCLMEFLIISSAFHAPCAFRRLLPGSNSILNVTNQATFRFCSEWN